MNTLPTRSKESQRSDRVVTCRLRPPLAQKFKALQLAYGNINANQLITALIEVRFKELKAKGYID